MDKHRIFILLTVIQLTVLMVLALYALEGSRDRREIIRAKADLVRSLTLTDLSIWTEARYTRHPSQADSFTPFQDFPSAPEHFPAGSIVPPTPRGQ
jgi:hypothetical protein